MVGGKAGSGGEPRAVFLKLKEKKNDRSLTGRGLGGGKKASAAETNAAESRPKKFHQDGNGYKKKSKKRSSAHRNEGKKEGTHRACVRYLTVTREGGDYTNLSRGVFA